MGKKKKAKKARAATSAPSGPITFELAGGTFRCRAVPPPQAVDHVDQIEVPNDGDQEAVMRALGLIVDFLLAVVEDDDRGTFLLALRTGLVDDGLLVDVANQVITAYAQRYRVAAGTARVPAGADLPPTETTWPSSHKPVTTLDQILDINDRVGGIVGENA